MKFSQIRPRRFRYFKRGFGFVELFVVISIIGVLVSLAIPAMSGIFGRADNAKAQRNAQSLVSTFNAARAAGNTTSFANAAQVISEITTAPGINGRGGYANSIFYVPLAPADLAEASAKITPTLVGTPTEGNLTIVSQ